jgi:CheY-like chemotaxis protein
VLVVDDSPQNRLVLLDLLEPLGFEVALAEDGRDGIEQARRLRPDLILMDLVMPVMMGFEAVPQIRQIPELAHVPIIAVSASVLEVDQDQSRRVGCDDFLSKPIEAERLYRLLARHLGLQWRYEPAPRERIGDDEAGGPHATPAGEILPPPQAELEALYELARFGNMERIQERARYLEALGEHYRPFAGHLYRLAEEFEDEKIQAFITHYLSAATVD